MTNTANSNLLDSGHLELLRKTQRQLNDLLPLMDAAEACGVDCDQYRNGHAYLAARTQQYLERFFPDEYVQPDESVSP